MSNGDNRRSNGNEVGFYVDATDYETGTDEERTKCNGTVGSGLTRNFGKNDKLEEDNGTREMS